MILSLLLSTLRASAGDVGSHVSSTWYETIVDADGKTIWFQIHYPSMGAEYGAEADPSGGPFPLIGFMHGYLGQAWMYQSACDAFASMGFVVVNMDTETHAWMDPYALADYTQTALEWVEARSAEPDHWLHGMAADAPWTVMGHSMGGIAMASLVDQSERVDVAVGFAPYRDGDYLWDAYAAYGGAAFMIGGDEDETSTPEIVSGWLDDVDAPARGLYALVEGAGHQAVTDIELEAAALSDAEQLAVSIGLASSFLLAERFDDEQAYDALVCGPPTPLAALTARGTIPATSAVALEDGRLRLALVGAPGDEAVVYAGAGPGRGSTPDGVVGLAGPVEVARVSLVEGAACVEVPLPAELSAIAWLQVVHVRANGSAFARVIDVFATGAEPTDTGDTEDGATDSGSDTAVDVDANDRDDGLEIEPSGGCGCSSAPGSVASAPGRGSGMPGGVAPLVLLSVALRRRRRP